MPGSSTGSTRSPNAPPRCSSDFQFSKAAEGLYHYAWDEFCDWYVELAKVQLRDETLVATTRAVLGTVLDGLLRLLHPFVPFVTEELWTSLTGGETLVIAAWPTPSDRPVRESARGFIADLDKLVTEIRRFRADQGLAGNRAVPARLTGPTGLTGPAAALTRLTAAGDDFAPTAAALDVVLSAGPVTIEVDTSEAVDVEAEKARIRKDLAIAEKEIAATGGEARATRPSWARRPTTSSMGFGNAMPRPLAERDRLQARLDCPGRGRGVTGPEPDGSPFDDADLGPDDTEADVSGATADLDDETGEITPAAPPLTLPVVEALLDRRWPETSIEPTLERITALLDLLGNPQRAYPVIQIAGTNGKTSVSRMIDALLTRLGLRTGRFTSPHLQLVTERISLDGAPIDTERYLDTYADIAPYVDLVDAASRAAGGVDLSKFEVLTAMAFAAFADTPVEVAVIEVGLGGTWDSTNVVDARIAAITPIGIDHTDYLGDTLGEIAGNKAGIIKPGAVAVIGAQEPEAMQVLLGGRSRWTPRSPGSTASSPCWTGSSRSAASG